MNNVMRSVCLTAPAATPERRKLRDLVAGDLFSIDGKAHMVCGAFYIQVDYNKLLCVRMEDAEIVELYAEAMVEFVGVFTWNV